MMNTKTTDKLQFPEWIRFRIPNTKELNEVYNFLSKNNISTVCKSALCPNRGECWSRRTATFLLLGEICSRACVFCSVSKGRPLPPDPLEKDRIIECIEFMNLRYVVLTMVTRDDLSDGGAKHIAEVIKEIKRKFPKKKVEILASDFQGDKHAIQTVLSSNPDVFSHNVEVVNRLCSKVRDSKCSYERSLNVLETAKSFDAHIIIKSGFMVGLGETQEEVLQTLTDLSKVGCSIVTIGQYLQPTKRQVPVSRFVSPNEFEFYAHWAKEHLSLTVIAGPEVRSSYHADFWCDNTKGG